MASTSAPPGTRRQKVVIVGGGFGGIAAAKALQRGRQGPARRPERHDAAGGERAFDVTLVDRHNYHGFWPLLYQVATAGLAPDDVAHSIRGIFWGHDDVDVVMGTVTGVDLAGRTVQVEGLPDLAYDWLVLAAGSVEDDFGLPGVGDHAFPLKTLPEAVALRNHLIERFEEAHADPGKADDGFLTVVVAGGGPTGVEVCGALVELFAVLERDFKGLDVGQAQVVLVELADHLLPGFADQSRSEALHTLKDRGVDVRLETRITGVSADGVTLGDGSFLPTRTLVWAAGVRANRLADTLGVEQGRAGTVVVEDDLSVPGHPEVFVIGDMAQAGDRQGQAWPMLAPVAQQGARHVAACIRRRCQGLPTTPFQYRDKGKMATIGRRSAVAELPFGIRLRGTTGWLAWLGLHLVFLVGFRNRAAVLLDWAWNYVTADRAARVLLPLDDD